MLLAALGAVSAERTQKAVAVVSRAEEAYANSRHPRPGRVVRELNVNQPRCSLCMLVSSVVSVDHSMLCCLTGWGLCRNRFCALRAFSVRLLPCFACRTAPLPSSCRRGGNLFCLLSVALQHSLRGYRDARRRFMAVLDESLENSY